MDQENRSSPHRTGSTQSFGNSSAETNPTCSLTFAGDRARLMFGCYRRGDANDPDTYVAAVTAVLTHYSAEIVKAVTDPYSGLPSRKSDSGWTGMPDVADVKEACEHEATRRERIRVLSTLRPIPRIAGPKQNRGNVFVPETAPQYADMLKHTMAADPMDWRRDETRPGIWVPYPWLVDGPKAGHAGFTQFTEAKLRAMYPQREAAPAENVIEDVPFE